MFKVLAIAFALVTAGYFPLSFLAYQLFRAEAIRDRLWYNTFKDRVKVKLLLTGQIQARETTVCRSVVDLACPWGYKKPPVRLMQVAF